MTDTISIKNIPIFFIIFALFFIPLFTGGSACAQDKITVQDYYSRANSSPVYGIEGLKKYPFSKVKEEMITKVDKNPVVFKYGEFTNYFFGEMYGKKMKSIFSEAGYDPELIAKFLAQHRDESAVYLYRDGYLLLFDAGEESTYIMPLRRSAIEKLFAL